MKCPKCGRIETMRGYAQFVGSRVDNYIICHPSLGGCGHEEKVGGKA